MAAHILRFAQAIPTKPKLEDAVQKLEYIVDHGEQVHISLVRHVLQLIDHVHGCVDPRPPKRKLRRSR